LVSSVIPICCSTSDVEAPALLEAGLDQRSSLVWPGGGSLRTRILTETNALWLGVCGGEAFRSLRSAIVRRTQLYAKSQGQGGLFFRVDLGRDARPEAPLTWPNFGTVGEQKPVEAAAFIPGAGRETFAPLCESFGARSRAPIPAGDSLG
jgi:hypothetical protein